MNEPKILKDFPQAEEIAKMFHDTYEQYAIDNGWKTQKKCQVCFDNLPEANKKTMIDVAELVRGWMLRWGKQEAIKHWKKLNEKRDGQLGSDAAYTDGQMEWIELFFDLTREDLK